MARTWLSAAGVRVVDEAPAESGAALIRLGAAPGLAGAMAGVGAAGSALIGLLPGGVEPGFELPPIGDLPDPGDATVAIVGAGGLGCPAAIGLALAGVRRLRLIDDDVVDISNLPRQVLHRDEDVGRSKVESAADGLRRLVGDDLDLELVHQRLDPGNAATLLTGVDAVVEGSDNFPTKFRVNAAAVQVGIPAVIAGVLRMEGQALAVRPGADAACYRCLFPESPAPGAVPTCSSAGILGPVAGVLGLWQAALVLQMLDGRDAQGRLWTFDARSGSWQGFGVRRSAECVACGPDPDDPALRGAAEGDGPMCDLRS